VILAYHLYVSRHCKLLADGRHELLKTHRSESSGFRRTREAPNFRLTGARGRLHNLDDDSLGSHQICCDDTDLNPCAQTMQGYTQNGVSGGSSAQRLNAQLKYSREHKRQKFTKQNIPKLERENQIRLQRSTDAGVKRGKRISNSDNAPFFAAHDSFRGDISGRFAVVALGCRHRIGVAQYDDCLSLHSTERHADK